MIHRICVAALMIGATRSPLLYGQIDPAALLQQTRAKIVESAGKLPKYTCVQTVHRSRFETFSSVPSTGCHVGEPGRPAPMLAWQDRFKLDITVSGGTEIFSWAGAPEFQSGDAQQIVGGGLTGTGDFGPFLTDIFGSSPAESQYLGLEQDHGRALAVYSYRVPASASGYRIKTGPQPGDLATLAYEGKFWIDPKDAELSRITIVVPDPPLESETCRIETTIDYQRVRIGQSKLLLPQSTLMKLWDTDGARYENRLGYGACREFQSESVFRPEADSSAPQMLPAGGSSPAKAPIAIPHGITLRIALATSIDVGRAFAGDPVEGRLLRAIRARGRILAPEGAIVHGRIVRLEQHLRPSRYVTLGLRFDSLVVDGREVLLRLEAVPRFHEEKILVGSLEKSQGIGMFLLPGDQPPLDGRFVTEWKTLAGPQARPPTTSSGSGSSH